MTILFYTRFRPVNEKGGTEHTTQLVAAALRGLYGIRSISMWTKPFEGNMDAFDSEYQLPMSRRVATDMVEAIIRQHDVSCVILQGFFHDLQTMHNAIKRVGGCKLIFAHHFVPGIEILDKSLICEKCQNSRGLKRLRYKLKLALFPLFQIQSKLNLVRRYCLAYRLADKVVLLSKQYIKPFQRLAMIKDDSKFAVIPNAIPFSVMQPKFTDKEKVVLMVTRLDERQKRIKLALEIWKQAEADPRYSDWHFVVIGEGYNNESSMYNNWAHEHGIRNVVFLGRRNPVDYYRRASVFMMTSKFEGLPLTLLECKASYVTPIAFGTFSSVNDLIHDGEDGYIIEENDIDGFVTRLKTLMGDAGLRKQMAIAGVGNLEPFTVRNVMARWHDLLDSLEGN